MSYVYGYNPLKLTVPEYSDICNAEESYGSMEVGWKKKNIIYALGNILPCEEITSKIETLHYAESETFATLKKRRLWNFFHLFRNKNYTWNIYHMKDDDMKF